MNNVFGLPQIILLALLAYSIGQAVVQHGKPLEGHHSIYGRLLDAAILLSLLIAGGFFTK